MADDLEITDESRARAELFASEVSYLIDKRTSGERGLGWGLFETEWDNGIKRMGRKLAGETPVNDVIADALSFRRLLALAEMFDLPIPTTEFLGIGEVPVLNPALERHIPADFPWDQRSGIMDWWRARYYLVPGSERMTATPARALSGFRRGLTYFLGFRFEGFTVWQRKRESRVASGSGTPSVGSAAPGKAGFHIQLFSRHQNLAAYASPAYALKWRNLGSFTVPAKAILMPGAWIFGARGSPLPKFVWDSAPVFVPPNFTPSTTCF